LDTRIRRSPLITQNGAAVTSSSSELLMYKAISHIKNQTLCKGLV